MDREKLVQSLKWLFGTAHGRTVDMGGLGFLIGLISGGLVAAIIVGGAFAVGWAMAKERRNP